jgi:hypothetical protein
MKNVNMYTIALGSAKGNLVLLYMASDEKFYCNQYYSKCV